MDTDFKTAMDRVYRDVFERQLGEWAAECGYDTATMALLLLHGAVPGLRSLSLNIACDLPPELDQLTDEEFLGWLEAAASG